MAGEGARGAGGFSISGFRFPVPCFSGTCLQPTKDVLGRREIHRLGPQGVLDQ
jgi:hypothetical protein